MTGPALAPSLRAACERWRSRPAVTHRGRTLSYGRLWERIAALAGAYRRLGVEPGDRVVCQLPVCPEHLVAVAAAWACGAIHVGADKDLTGAELAALVARTGAAAAVIRPPPGASDRGGHVRAVREASPGTVPIVHGHEARPGGHELEALLAGPPADSLRPVGPDDTALLLLTSGTTGVPKAVVETRPALWAKMEFFAGAVDCGPDDVHLMCLPIAHVFGLKLTLMALTTGGRVVLVDRFTPEGVLRLVDEEQVTFLPGTPTHLTLLLRAHDPDRHRLDTLRWTVSAAASLPPGLFDELAERLGLRMLYVYGCSEGFLVQTADPDEIRCGSVGHEVFDGGERAPPDGTVGIVDPDTDEPLPVGQVGEIVFGSTAPVHYWDRPPAATDGRYHTGDLGRRDEQGRLYVTGRLKELINRGGLKVAPSEIEAVLVDHPAVADCAVIATPDPVLGEAICACVVPDGRLPGLAGLRDWLGQRLARHKLPDELCTPEAIPRSRVGKIDRAALAAVVIDDGLARERVRPRPPASTARRDAADH